jgi:nucleotide-binding universal stress UspA family protein
VLLIAYDGSTDAEAAIDHAAELFNGEQATVLCVWESFVDVMARTGGGLGYHDGGVNFEEIDSASQAGARERAEEGTRRAERAGLKAQPSVRVREATIAAAILAEAAEVDARAIVMGTRGLTGVKSLLLGSVSHAVLQHADRAVVVVPSPEVARERGQHH